MEQGLKRTGPDAYGSDPKRARVMAPSKVLHVRGLPQQCVEAELVAVVAPHAVVVKTLVLGNKGQAFLELADVQQATAVIQNFQYVQQSIRGKHIYFEYSDRVEVSGGGGGGNSGGGTAGGGGTASPTLIFAITNVTVPITLQNIVQVCQPHGEVLKIITFSKQGDFQALVQFRNNQEVTSISLCEESINLYNATQHHDMPDIYSRCSLCQT
jgi:hypothetical protein